MDVLREVHNQHLTCGICMDQYSEPKQLPCLHSFCRTCLTTHILKSVTRSGVKSFTCPVCRKMCNPADPDPNKVLEWSESFPDNFYIRSLIDTFEAQSESLTMQDQLTSLPAETETCPKHRTEAAVSYCLVKNTATCVLCLMSSMHDGCANSHMAPEEARGIAGRHLRDFKDRVESLSSRVGVVQARLTTKPSEMKFKKEELTIDISAHFSNIRTNLNKILLQKEKDALVELNDVIHKEESCILEAKDEAKSLSGSLKSTYQLFDKLVEDRPVGVLAVVQTVEKQIAAYERTTQNLEDRFRKELDTKLCKNQDLFQALEKIPWGKVCNGNTLQPNIPSGDQSLLGSEPQNTTHSFQSSHQGPASAIDGDHRVTNFPGGAEASATTSISRTFLSASLDQFTPPSSHDPNSEQLLEHVEETQRKSAGASRLFPVSTTSMQASRTSPPPEASRTSPPPVHSSSSAGVVQSPPAAPDHGFKLTLIHEFSGLCPEDVYPSTFVGMCHFRQNCLLILDRWNKKLKLIQICGRILFFFKFEASMEPWDMTNISNGNVAVTCPSYSHFLMLTVLSSSMQITSHVKTVTGYTSLVHLDDARFAGGVCKPFGSPRVDIVDASGREAIVLMQLPAPVSYPRSLERTLDGHLMICDWGQMDVRVFESGNFQQIFRYKGTGKVAAFREPVDVTQDRQGHLYIADRNVRKVHIVSRTTEAMLAFLSMEIPNKVNDPKVVAVVDVEECYSSSGEVLVVATGGGKIFVYELVTPPAVGESS